MTHKDQLISPARELERRGKVNRVKGMDGPTFGERGGVIDDRPTDLNEQHLRPEVARAVAGIGERLGWVAGLARTPRQR